MIEDLSTISQMKQVPHETSGRQSNDRAFAPWGVRAPTSVFRCRTDHWEGLPPQLIPEKDRNEHSYQNSDEVEVYIQYFYNVLQCST